MLGGTIAWRCGARIAAFLLGGLLAWGGPTLAAEPASVTCFAVWEAEFHAATPAPADAPLPEDLRVEAELVAPSGGKRRVPLFWDGGDVWRLRFAPDEPGRWRYFVHTLAPKPGPQKPAPRGGLDGREGSFVCARLERPAKDDWKGGAERFLLHGPVEVDPSGTHFAHRDGAPFFWLGDTAWCGPAKASLADWKQYLAGRAAQGFTVIQFNVVSPWRTAPTDAAGRTASTGASPARIVPEYFQRLDPYVAEIAQAGMLAAPVMVWAHKKGDAGFDLPEEDCLRLARHQFARWNAYPVAWIVAGDARYRGEEAERWKRVGRALFDPAAGGRPAALVATHPTGENWPWNDWRDEPWLTFLGYQSGHGDGPTSWKWLVAGPPAAAGNAEAAEGAPRRPIVNLEPVYEDHLAYQSKKPHSAYNVRRACYASLLVDPPAGVTYGAHGVWSWETEAGRTPQDHPGSGVAKPWKEAVQLPGAADVQRLAEAFQSFRWWKLRPAPRRLHGAPTSDDPGRFTLVAAAEDDRLLVAYLAAGGAIELDLAGFDADAPAVWFDPRTGKRTPARRQEAGRFAAPDDQDWLLIVGR